MNKLTKAQSERFDEKFVDFIDHNFVISNNKPITVGIEQIKQYLANELSLTRKGVIEEALEKMKCRKKNHENQLCGGCEECNTYQKLDDLLTKLK